MNPNTVNLTPEECAAIFRAGFRIGIGYATVEEAKRDFGRKCPPDKSELALMEWIISELNVRRT